MDVTILQFIISIVEKSYQKLMKISSFLRQTERKAKISDKKNFMHYIHHVLKQSPLYRFSNRSATLSDGL